MLQLVPGFDYSESSEKGCWESVTSWECYLYQEYENCNLKMLESTNILPKSTSKTLTLLTKFRGSTDWREEYILYFYFLFFCDRRPNRPTPMNQNIYCNFPVMHISGAFFCPLESSDESHCNEFRSVQSGVSWKLPNLLSVLATEVPWC
jgi:hypothetical protein